MYANLLGNQKEKSMQKKTIHKKMTAEHFFFTFCLHIRIFFINVFPNVSMQRTLFPDNCHAADAMKRFSKRWLKLQVK